MKKLLLTATIIFCFAINAHAFLNGGDVQNQSLLNNIQNQDINLNTVLNNICNKNTNLNKNKVDSTIENSFVIEDVREYVQPAQISYPIAPQGHTEKRTKNIRRRVSFHQQTMFTKTWSLKRVNTMLSGNPYGTKVTITPFVKKGDYDKTDKITIVSHKAELPKGAYVEIALAIGKCKGNSNSALITAKTIKKGCELGANYLILFNSGSDRRFKHRGLGGGGGAADATNAPDTVFSGLFSGHLGSNRYEEFPFEKGYLVRKVD